MEKSWRGAVVKEVKSKDNSQACGSIQGSTNTKARPLVHSLDTSTTLLPAHRHHRHHADELLSSHAEARNYCTERLTLAPSLANHCTNVSYNTNRQPILPFDNRSSARCRRRCAQRELLREPLVCPCAEERLSFECSLTPANTTWRQLHPPLLRHTSAQSTSTGGRLSAQRVHKVARSPGLVSVQGVLVHLCWCFRQSEKQHTAQVGTELGDEVLRMPPPFACLVRFTDTMCNQQHGAISPPASGEV